VRHREGEFVDVLESRGPIGRIRHVASLASSSRCPHVNDSEIRRGPVFGWYARMLAQRAGLLDPDQT
jgi:hypothetical protein